MAKYLEMDLTITSGLRPPPKGAGAHLEGKAFDLGKRNNTGLTRAMAVDAYKQIFNQSNSWAIEEYGCFHFQNRPDLGGNTGFQPGIRDRYGR